VAWYVLSLCISTYSPFFPPFTGLIAICSSLGWRKEEHYPAEKDIKIELTI